MANTLALKLSDRVNRQVKSINYGEQIILTRNGNGNDLAFEEEISAPSPGAQVVQTTKTTDIRADDKWAHCNFQCHCQAQSAIVESLIHRAKCENVVRELKWMGMKPIIKTIRAGQCSGDNGQDYYGQDGHHYDVKAWFANANIISTLTQTNCG